MTKRKYPAPKFTAEQQATILDLSTNIDPNVAFVDEVRRVVNLGSLERDYPEDTKTKIQAVVAIGFTLEGNATSIANITG